MGPGHTLREKVQTQRQERDPEGPPAGSSCWLTGPPVAHSHFHATEIWIQRWLSLQELGFYWTQSLALWKLCSSSSPFWLAMSGPSKATVMVFCSCYSVFSSRHLPGKGRDSCFISASCNTSCFPAANGREGEQGRVLLHYFQLNATPFVRLFQSASANESLDIPLLPAPWPFNLEHFLSPSAIHITHCLFRHSLTSESHLSP